MIEVGVGGQRDTTNVADGKVAVVTPVAIDHAEYLGGTPAEIAGEKAGIIKRGAVAVIAQQELEVAEVLQRRAAQVGASLAREGLEFRVVEREIADGGQLLTIQGLTGTYDGIYLPLHGAYQAHNAATALAAVEAFLAGSLAGCRGLDADMVRAGFGAVRSPGRLEVLRTRPTVLLDAAHNPHGARAMASGVGETFSFEPLIGCVAMMQDKDIAGVLEAFEPIMAPIVCTQNSTVRAMPTNTLAKVAAGIFGDDRVTAAEPLNNAIDLAIQQATQHGTPAGNGGVLIAGSAITAGEARNLLPPR